MTRRYPFRGGDVIAEFDAESSTYTRHDLHVDRVFSTVAGGGGPIDDGAPSGLSDETGED